MSDFSAMVALLIACITAGSAVMVFIFRYFAQRISKLKDDHTCLERMVGQLGIILGRADEKLKKIEQWYEHNIPELHVEVKDLCSEIANARVSVARLKAVHDMQEAKDLLRQEKE